MNEKEKMIQGLPYDPVNPRLVLDRTKANRICTKYNKRAFSEINMRSRLLRKLLHTKGNFWIQPSFRCDYGYNITLGKNVMINYNCVILDVCPVTIGDSTLIGPGTHIYTACHSMDAVKRRNNEEYGKPVTIGEDVWIGGNCVILPGVTIGDRTVIGAGSVVTKDLPSDVVAVGNPCKIIKKLD